MDADDRQAEPGDLLRAYGLDPAHAVAWIDDEIPRGEGGGGLSAVGGRAERRVGHRGGDRGSACHFLFTWVVGSWIWAGWGRITWGRDAIAAEVRFV